MKVRYFDHAATTPVREEVIKEMIPYFGIQYGNASTMYSLGRNAKKAMNISRKKIEHVLNADSNEVYFTSCGSESDNLAIKGFAYANKNRGNHIITSKIEHHAVLDTCKSLEKQGFKVTYLNVDKNGFIDLNELENAIDNTTILISIMFANNEIGTIEPIKEIGTIAKKHNITFHTDAVQAIGNVKIDVKELNIDMLSLSGHKFYAPKGVGALYVKKGIEFEKIQDGGEQENNKRAGTENVSEIVGMGAAIELIYREFDAYNKNLKELRNYFLSEIQSKISNITINGDLEKRLPGNVNISFESISGGELLYELDKRGICASAGSACSTSNPMPSHVLMAIGLNSKLAENTLRITFGKDNTKKDVEFLINELEKIVNKRK
jgi:cysteine desulfurase